MATTNISKVSNSNKFYLKNYDFNTIYEQFMEIDEVKNINSLITKLSLYKSLEDNIKTMEMLLKNVIDDYFDYLQMDIFNTDEISELHFYLTANRIDEYGKQLYCYSRHLDVEYLKYNINRESFKFYKSTILMLEENNRGLFANRLPHVLEVENIKLNSIYDNPILIHKHKLDTRSVKSDEHFEESFEINFMKLLYKNNINKYVKTTFLSDKDTNCSINDSLDEFISNLNTYGILIKPENVKVIKDDDENCFFLADDGYKKMLGTSWNNITEKRLNYISKIFNIDTKATTLIGLDRIAYDITIHYLNGFLMKDYIKNMNHNIGRNHIHSRLSINSEKTNTKYLKRIFLIIPSISNIDNLFSDFGIMLNI